MNHYAENSLAGAVLKPETLSESVVVPPSFLERMIEHAQTCHPLECCGVLGGRGSIITSVHFLRNDLESSSQFFANPKELINAVRKMRNSGEEMTGIFHSHPHSLPTPSERDRDENYYPGLFYFIISLAQEEPEIRCYILSQEGEYHSVQII